MTASRLELAVMEMAALREKPGFEEAVFVSWDLPAFADRFCISHEEATEILRSTRPAPDKSRFQWLEAITKACGHGRISQKGLIVANVLFGSFNDRSPYCWPSQQTIANRAGWKSVRAVTYGLSQLSELGAIQRIVCRDLPVAIAQRALGKRDGGGSGRDVRSVAYKRIPPSMWEQVDPRTERSINNRNEVFHLNHKVQPQPAAPEYFPYGSDTPLTSQYEDNLYGNDGAKHG